MDLKFIKLKNKNLLKIDFCGFNKTSRAFELKPRWGAGFRIVFNEVFDDIIA